MTTSTITTIAPTIVALEFSVSESELAAAEDRVFRRLVKNVRLPGFRKGKVPRRIFDQTYGREAITSEAVEEVLPEIYAKAVREHDLEPVERPQFEIVEEAGGRPARLKATVEVRPRIELGTYRGIVVSRPPYGVTEPEVEHSLEALAKERATLVPVNRPAQLGDIVTIDYEGSLDGTAFEGGSGENQVIELIEGRFVPGFVTGIAGMPAGQTKQFQAHFPEDYPVANLAGKTADFTVKLHDVKEMELPPLDDDFAKAISQSETIAELRSDVRRRLEAVAAGRARRATGNAIVGQLLTTHDFPLPASLVENELNAIVEEVRAASTSEVTDEAELREAHRKEAESRVKASLLIQAIAKAENITATPADLAAELEVLSRRYGQPVARLRKALGNNLLALMDGIVRNKTLDLLIDNAVVTVDEETLYRPS
ncbi:MAG: trigger factor [Candidatus Eremiobacteraeota bacterium]|nr:trigger factor [Candidatus Eremiobacteraeota bacterium]